MDLRTFLLIKVALVLCVTCAPVREIELTKGWTLSNQNGSITRTVEIPSGIYSAYNPSDPEQVLKSYNDVNLRWLAKDNWTYTTTFDAPQNFINTKFVNLTFHGIDTISVISLNNHVIGTTNNMFVRYSFNVQNILKDQNNVLVVQLSSPIYVAAALARNNSYTPPECPPNGYHGECHMNFLRKMQASFGWDWGLAAPSMGIWKRVTLEVHDVGIIRDIDVIVFKQELNWNLLVRVYLETGRSEPFSGELTMYAVDLLDQPVNKIFNNTLNSSNSVLEFNQIIFGEKVELWWPNGYGNQKLYHLHFTFKAKTSDVYDPRLLLVSQKSIRIGFRTIELVQDDIEEPMESGYSFYFRVNGVPIFMKGTNWIPAHILPEKANEEAKIKHLLKATKDAHMTMIRVWGGGIYESDYFYDLADKYGIFIWHDMMFACAMYPIFSEFLQSVREETIQNVKRIAHHPSIAIWATNNENEAALAQNWYSTSKDYKRFASEYRQLYVGTILHELKMVGNSARPDPIVSSPSNGRKSQEDEFLSNDPQSDLYGDIHYYNYLADGWSPEIFPKPRFASEYGFQSFPRKFGWEKSIGSNDSLEEIINHRQHSPFLNAPISLLVNRHLPLPSADSEDYWEAMIYFSQIAQAMATKTETEVYRSQRNLSANTMGALYWQLNDVWIAPSWSSIDFDGNFKILHHWAMEFMAPITIIAHKSDGENLNIFITRDTIEDYNLNLTASMKVYLWSDLFPKEITDWNFQIEPNSVKLLKTLKISDIFKGPFAITNSFVEFSVKNNNEVLSKTYFFPDAIKSSVGITDPQIEVEIANSKCQSGIYSSSLAIKVQHPAIFVYIEIIRPEIKTYELSKNGYIQLDPMETIHLEFYGDCKTPLTLRDIKVLTVNQFMKT